MNVISNIFSFIHPESLIIDMLAITYDPPGDDRQYIGDAIKQPGWLATWAVVKNKYLSTANLSEAEKYWRYFYQT
jgi:hypothetical protein